jgi:nucleotide-binding universal stress UspA family protein
MTLFQIPIINASGALMGEWYVPWLGSFETARQDSQDYLEGVASDLRELEIEVSTATWVGAVAESIIDYAEVNDGDLIAMCTHGRTGLARWALGSIADRVLRAGDKPILLVRAR